MKFDYEAYAKVYPEHHTDVAIDSAVEGYTPSAQEGGKPNTNDSAVDDVAQPAANSAQPPKKDDNAANGVNVPNDGTTPPAGENAALDGE